MSSRQHTALLLFAIFLAFVWLQVGWLKPYALQAVALSSTSYILLKKFKRAKFHHLLPQQNSIEMALVTFSLMLLIGSSGTLHSPLFPLTYIHLFFLVMSSSRSTAITVGPLTALFHFGLEPTITLSNVAYLTTIPIMLFFFLFAKEQHDAVLKDQQTIAQEEKLLTEYTEKTQKLQQAIAKLEEERVEKSEMIDAIHAVLNQVQDKLFSWSQQYFACEPKALSEVEELYREIDQAIASPISRSKK